MKCGIITFHNTLNCGATLQAYALCKYIRNQGVDCEIIDYQCQSIVERELTFHKSSNLVKTIISYVLLWPRQKSVNREFLDFLNKENMLSKKKYSEKNIFEANKEYDVFITGSDQVWNTVITKNDFNFFLRFVEDEKKRYAFSASIGEPWKTSEYDEIFNLIKRYDYICMREKSDCAFLKEKWNVTCHHVSDPTMLLDGREWGILAKKPQESDYILLYNPESGIEKAAHEYSKIHNKKIVYIGTGKVKFGNKGSKTVLPDEWIGYFKYAEAVFTDSYHGLLFSLYFQKPVWTAYNGNRGNRQASLYEKLRIEACQYSCPEDLESSINYLECEPLLAMFRYESMKHIDKMLKQQEITDE